MKYSRFGCDGRMYVKRRKGSMESKVSAKICQERRGSVMVLAAFLLNGPGPIIRITETMNGQSYLKHFQNHLVPHAKSKIGRNYHLLFDNAPCHKSKLLKSIYRSTRSKSSLSCSIS